ncbi:MAG: hypothetical protein OXP71_12325, partial [Candidatus Poribacteria bacterium]|nr:hypothetical protein [Candidatus Poribacteria bacterium]
GNANAPQDARRFTTRRDSEIAPTGQNADLYEGIPMPDRTLGDDQQAAIRRSLLQNIMPYT